MKIVAAAFLAILTALTAVPGKPPISEDTKTYIQSPTQVKTESRFSQKEITEPENISFDTKFRGDPQVEFGKTKTITEGKDGRINKVYLVTYFDNKEIERTLIKTETANPQDKVVSKGTKIVWKEETSERCGTYKYWQKYENVYMTTYTPQCEGCDAWTSIGLKAGYGIIAVDPKKIPYWTRVCIPRYGIAIAGDTGGAMRSYSGLLIDLGFPSLSPKDKWLTTGRYDMYILNNEDKADTFYVVQ